MRRRTFIATGLATVGAVTVAGRVSAVDGRHSPSANAVDSIRTSRAIDELPRYSAWIPDERHDDPDAGVAFTHLDWEAFAALEDDVNDAAERDDGFDEPDEETIVDVYPIIGLPMQVIAVTPIVHGAILPYPFAEDVVPDGPPTEGVATATTTWIDDRLVLRGEYDPDVFDEWFTDGFEAVDERDGFTVYAGEDPNTAGLAFAVSDAAVIVRLPADPDPNTDETTEESVLDLVDRRLEEDGRMIDDETGAWLFEATGDARLAAGAWERPEREAALAPEETDPVEPERVDELEAIFDDAESFLNTVTFDVDGGEMRDPAVHFAAIYPDDAVPDERDVRRRLIGGAFVPHELAVGENRIHAMVSLEE